MEVGQEASRELHVTDEIIKAFASITGDKNPLHLDDSFAVGTVFGRRIAHGMLVASVLSAIIANDLPGSGSIYLKQDLNFLLPVYVDERVIGVVRVVELRSDKPIATLETSCWVGDRQVIRGVALVKYATPMKGQQPRT